MQQSLAQATALPLELYLFSVGCLTVLQWQLKLVLSVSHHGWERF